MTLRATLRLAFETEEEARKVAKTLHVDDDAFVTTRREGPILVVEARAERLASLRRALDDVLACAGVSEAVIKSAMLDE